MSTTATTKTKTKNKVKAKFIGELRTICKTQNKAYNALALVDDYMRGGPDRDDDERVRLDDQQIDMVLDSMRMAMNELWAGIEQLEKLIAKSATEGACPAE